MVVEHWKLINDMRLLPNERDIYAKTAIASRGEDQELNRKSRATMTSRRLLIMGKSRKKRTSVQITERDKAKAPFPLSGRADQMCVSSRLRWPHRGCRSCCRGSVRARSISFHRSVNSAKTRAFES